MSTRLLVSQAPRSRDDLLVVEVVSFRLRVVLTDDTLASPRTLFTPWAIIWHYMEYEYPDVTTA